MVATSRSGGKNRKPNEVKRALGNPGQHHLPAAAEVVKLSSVETAPVSPQRPLGRHGQHEWDTTTSSDAVLWLSETDMQALSVYCESVDDYVHTRAQLYTLDVSDPLYWRVAKRVEELRRGMILALAELGLTPLGRSRLGVAEVAIREGVARLSAGRVADAAEF
jgi:phage terminase small subunit